MDELCKVCGRVQFGEIIRLGFKRWRHDDCHPGSRAWCEAYVLHPIQTEEARILFQNSTKEAS